MWWGPQEGLGEWGSARFSTGQLCVQQDKTKFWNTDTLLAGRPFIEKLGMTNRGDYA